MSYEDDDFDPRPKMSKVTTVTWLAIFACAGAYFYSNYDHIGMVVTAVVMVSSFAGYKLGFSRITASIIGFGAAFAFAPQMGMSIEHHFADWFGISGLLNRFVSVASCGFLIALVSVLVAGFIANRVLYERPKLTMTNSWLGFFCGGAEGGFAMLLLLGGILVVQPSIKEMAGKNAHKSSTVKFLNATKAKTDSSVLGPVVKKYNPFKTIPQLNQFERIQATVTVLGDAKNINGLMHHPSIQALKADPEVQEAINSLMEDPEIKEVLNGGLEKDGDAVVRLLNNPSVMKLLDQPAFRKTATEIIDTVGKGNNR